MVGKLLILLLDLSGIDQHFEQPMGIIHFSFLLVGRKKERKYIEARPQVHSLSLGRRSRHAYVAVDSRNCSRFRFRTLGVP